MYINFVYLSEKGYSTQDLIYLIQIKQKELYLMAMIPEAGYEEYEHNGLISFTKGGSTIWEKARITDKGKQFITQATTYGYTDDIARLATRLQEFYTDIGANKGNHKNVVNRICWFISESPFTLTDIFNGVQDYINSVDRQYVMGLENLFWKQPNVYAVNMDLKDSKLFEFLCDSNDIEQSLVIEPTEYASNLLAYAKSVLNTKAPKNLDPLIYVTESYAGDVRAKKRIRERLLNTFKK